MNQRKKAIVVVVKLLYRCISASLVVVLGAGEAILINEFIAFVVDFNNPIDAITPKDSAASGYTPETTWPKCAGPVCRYWISSGLNCRLGPLGPGSATASCWAGSLCAIALWLSARNGLGAARLPAITAPADNTKNVDKRQRRNSIEMTFQDRSTDAREKSNLCKTGMAYDFVRVLRCFLFSPLGFAGKPAHRTIAQPSSAWYSTSNET